MDGRTFSALLHAITPHPRRRHVDAPAPPPLPSSAPAERLAELPLPRHLFPRAPRPVTLSAMRWAPARTSRPRESGPARVRLAAALLAVAALAAGALALAGCGGRPPRPSAAVDRVTDILPRPGGALVLTEGGAYRLELPRPGAGPVRLALSLRGPTLHDRMLLGSAAARAERRGARSGDCDYEPRGPALRARCAEGDTLIAFGGFAVTAAAEFRGRVYAGTRGGGLRAADSPREPIAGFPRIVTALAQARGFLLCGTNEGLYLYDGATVSSLKLGGAAALAPAEGPVRAGFGL